MMGACVAAQIDKDYYVLALRMLFLVLRVVLGFLVFRWSSTPSVQGLYRRNTRTIMLIVSKVVTVECITHTLPPPFPHLVFSCHFLQWSSDAPPRRAPNEMDGQARKGQNRARVEWTDGTDASYQWAMDRMADLPPPPDSVDGNGDNARQWSVSHEKTFLLQGDPDVPPEGRARSLLRDVLEEYRRRSGSGEVSGSGSGSGCLTESWVGGERFAWVDLQAGPFEWGPAAGGEGYKSASLALLPRRPAIHSSSPVGGSSRRVVNDGGLSYAVKALRGKMTTRMNRLEILETQMGCTKRATGDGADGVGVERGVSRGGARRLGVAAVACQEVSAQLAFLRRFRAREEEVLPAAGVAARADSIGGGDGDEIDTETLRAMQGSHVALLEEVLGELAPATESDSRLLGSTREEMNLGVESQVLLARLAALVSSLARGVITPASALPLPLPPLGEHGAAAHAKANGREAGSASSPYLPSSVSANGNDRRWSSPFRLPIGPALTQARGSRVEAPTSTGRESQMGTGTAHPLLSAPPPPALEFFIPDSLAFTLYVVRAQDVYPPLGAPSTQGYAAADPATADGRRRGKAGERDVDAAVGSSGFDLPAFQAGAMSLRLPNQQASFTVHQVAASADMELATALAGAMRESSVNVVTAEG